MLRWVPCPLIAMAAWGCAPSLETVARTHAAKDLDCMTQVTVDTRQGRMFVAGCGRWIEYSCFYAMGRPVCASRSDPEPLPEDGG
jgi:hypothetical protein